LPAGGLSPGCTGAASGCAAAALVFLV
jgi:hypothetical protein